MKGCGAVKNSNTGNNRRTLRLSPTQIIAISFAGIILVGTLLLCLPIASRTGQSAGFLDALFTATSATCVTGLVAGDTWSMWSGFGQIVILCLIELGGLGFMSAASLVIFLLRKKIGLRQRMLIAQALSLNEMEGAVALQKWVLFGRTGENSRFFIEKTKFFCSNLLQFTVKKCIIIPFNFFV